MPAGHPLRVAFHPHAEAELVEAVEYYEEQRAGMGLRFAAALARTLDRLSRVPETGPVLERDVRRMMVPRYPYGVIYAVEHDRVLVLAVMHGRRLPRYWSARGR